MISHKSKLQCIVPSEKMGSKNVCTDCKNINLHKVELDKGYNIIGPKFIHQSYHDTKEIIPTEFMIFPPKYVLLLHNLRNNHARFEDQYFPSSNSSIGALTQKVTWKRISQIIQKLNIYNEISANKSANNRCDKLFSLLDEIQNKYPEAIKKFFKGDKIVKQGFILILLPCNGNSSDLTEVIIDDYIPMDSGGKNYYFATNGKISIWKILLHKAIAKIFESYSAVNLINRTELFEQLMGIPIPHGSQVQVDKSIKVNSTAVNMSDREEQVFKFTVLGTETLTICTWHQRPDVVGLDESLIPLTYGEIAKEVNTTYNRCHIALQSQRRKRFFKEEKSNNCFLTLEAGVYYLFLYNLTQAAQCFNLVAAGSQQICFHRYKKAERVRELMVQQLYYANQSKLMKVKESLNVSVKALWDHYRCILCFHNESHKRIRIKANVKKGYEKEVQCQEPNEGIIEPQKDRIIIFWKRTQQNIGNFYQFEQSYV